MRSGRGYELDGEIFRSARTVVWRGRARDGSPVLVKTPVAPIPEPAELARYRRERALLELLAGPGIPAVVELVEEEGTVELVTAWRGGRSLAAWMAERPLTVEEVLGILDDAAGILARVHAAGVVHKDVDPANLVWDGRPGTLQLVDFGISVREGETAPPGRPAGTLRYIAPEATGRSAQVVGWRSDLYSLGATAWHLLVGRPPFEEADPLALVHAHLARAPEPPARANAAVPECLSAVVLRLMEKDPDRRYRSAQGLAADLRRCREALARGEPGAFPLGRDDVAPRFALPDRLYGREGEVAALVAALARAIGGGGTAGIPLVLVEGPSGIGKSALVAELADPVRRRGVRLVRGRFEQLTRDAPLKAVSEACDALVAGLLAADEVTLEGTRSRLRAALGDAGGLLVRTIPTLGVLLPDLPAPPDLIGAAAAVRTMQAYGALLGSIASAAAPVALFLDDLQWADGASLDLVEFLVGTPDVQGLLLLGGYRDDEVGDAHPVTRMRERIGSSGAPLLRIRPGPLDLAATVALVADACRCRVEVATPIATALHERTGGNPFFLRTLLARMYESGLLVRDGAGWTWAPGAEARLGLADNVVEAVLQRLAPLGDTTREALGVAAHIGSRFPVRLLARALDRAEAEVAAALGPAVEAGLLRPENEAWGLLPWGTGDDIPSGCQFVHDRVQEAALRLLAPERVPSLHLRLARLLTEAGAPTGGLLFDALDHYRAALGLVAPEERARVARLALDAAGEASRSAAFDVALRACELGLEVLERRDPALWERLCTRAVEVADAAADQEALDRHADALIAGASSVAAMGPAYVARIRAHTRAERFQEAIDTADAFLARFGERINLVLRPLVLARRLAAILWAMRGRTAAELVNAPEATDPTAIARMRVHIATAKAVASTHPEVIPDNILLDVHQVLTYGATADGLFAWTGWAMLVTEALRRPDLGAPFCELALARAERTGSSTWADIAWVYYATLYHWRTELPQVADALLRSRSRALDLGEASAAIAVSSLADQVAFFAGKALPELAIDLAHTRALARRYRMAMWAQGPLQHVVAVLRGETEPAPIPDPPGGGSFALADASMARLLLAVFLGDREAGWQIARDPPAVMMTPLRSATHFVWAAYQGVALYRAAGAGLLSTAEARRRSKPARKLLERWAKALPARRYRLLWMDAAEAALRGEAARAIHLYERAIELARSAGIRQDAALMAEHAAEVADAVGQPRLRQVFLEEAAAGYRAWGATRKVDQLAAQLPARPTATTTSTGSLSGDLDVETLFRAAIALSGEIRLDRLVGEVVAVTMQNAGATRGFLVTDGEAGLVVEVGRDIDGAALVTPGTPLGELAGLPTSVVQYVARTGERLVLANGAADPRFAADPHFRAAPATSILCAPLVHKGRRTGIVYLENHLVTGCFTPARLVTVEVLASQAAVSIENARLVDTLEAKVAERTHLLQEALAETRLQHRQLVESHQALVHSEKMAALGQLVAGVAHELNTPLGAIVASTGNAATALDQALQELPSLLATATADELAGLRTLLDASSHARAGFSSREERKLRAAAEARLVAAGIPEPRVLARALVGMGLGDDLDPHLPLLGSPRAPALVRGAADLASLRRNNGTIRTAADRAAKIVFALKTYAHPGTDDDAPVEGALTEHLEIVLTLYQNQTKHGVEVVRDFRDRGLLRARHQELDQVWTNLVHNALQAMQSRGRLELRVARDGAHVTVQVVDSGPGIPPDVLPRVFDPFYTTKPQGEGTGLGLSISREIVARHGGTIGVESAPGQTTFTVSLPVGES